MPSNKRVSGLLFLPEAESMRQEITNCVRCGKCDGWDYYSQHPLDILKIWEGGLASHGGGIGIILAVWLYSKRVSHRSMCWTFDRLTFSVALAGFFIRMGNLMNHEIFGHTTDLPWGFRFITNWFAVKQMGAEPIYTDPSHKTDSWWVTGAGFEPSPPGSRACVLKCTDPSSP